MPNQPTTTDTPHRPTPSPDAPQRILVILTNQAFISRTRHSRDPLQHNAQLENDHNIDNDDNERDQEMRSSNNQQDCTQCSSNQNCSQDNSNCSGHKYRFTGVDAVEVVTIWDALSPAGTQSAAHQPSHGQHQQQFEVVFASPRGGPVAVDPYSMEQLVQNESLRQCMRQSQRELINRLSHTLPLSWVCQAPPHKHQQRAENQEQEEDESSDAANQWAAVIVPGAHGALVDLPACRAVGEVISEVHSRGGIVATIGHGSAALLNCPATPSSHRQQREEERKQQYLVEGKRICCFSDAEEREINFAEALPYSLQQKLQARGARIENEERRAFTQRVVQDGRLITAQNARSAGELCQRVQEAIRSSTHHQHQQRQQHHGF